jgi:hypothetical protein
MGLVPGTNPTAQTIVASPWPSNRTKQPNYSWAVYHLKSTPAKLVGNVDNQPDEESAIQQAIEQFNVPVNQRGRLMAQGAIDLDMLVLMLRRAKVFRRGGGGLHVSAKRHMRQIRTR